MFGVLDVTSKDTTFLRQADLRLVVTHEEVLAALEWISKEATRFRYRDNRPVGLIR